MRFDLIKTLALVLALIGLCGTSALANDNPGEDNPKTPVMTITTSNGRAMTSSDGGKTWRIVEKEKAEEHQQYMRTLNGTISGTMNAVPNPAVGPTTISYTTQTSGNLTLVIYDTKGGEMLHLDEGYRGPGEYQTSIDVSEYTGGIYYYRLYSDGSPIATSRLVVAR